MKAKGRPALRRMMSFRCCPGARRRRSSSCSQARGSWFRSALASLRSLQLEPDWGKGATCVRGHFLRSFHIA